MKPYWYTLLVVLVIAFSSCDEKKSNSQVDRESDTEMETDPPTIDYSFAFIGCNRVDRHDIDNSAATNASSANLAALQRIFKEITAEARKPDLFFFLGDLVLAETDTTRLTGELPAWVQQYKDLNFSKISQAGIELVAIPGNHEMLTYAKHIKEIVGKDTVWMKETEWPLAGATDIWMRHMADYMPADRDQVTGADSLVNRMTFSFVRKGIGFILMNTDTYNPPTKENPWGIEGQIPTKWIVNKIHEYKADPAIQHVFVLGHKPYYVSGLPETGHDGLPEGPVLWPELENNHVVAMLSAHLHDYQRVQPGDSGTYQVIAGNGGSPGEATFFGYSTIHVWSDGRVELVTKGWPVGDPYYEAVPDSSTKVHDQTILTWEKNANPYPGR